MTLIYLAILTTTLSLAIRHLPPFVGPISAYISSVQRDGDVPVHVACTRPTRCAALRQPADSTHAIDSQQIPAAPISSNLQQKAKRAVR